jgi:hypothetical protein
VTVNTNGRGGESLRKHINVQTNDPKNPRVDLTIVGKVEGLLDIHPRYIRLIGTQGKDLHQVVKIVPKAKYPFTIASVKAREGKNIDYDLQPLGKNPSRDGYSLTVRNKRTDQGTYRDYITIQTDLKEMPIIRIPVTGRIMRDRRAPTGKS